MEKSTLEKLNKARGSRRAVLNLQDVETGQSRIVIEGEAVDASIEGAVKRAFLAGKSTMCEIDGRDYFLNVYLPPTRLVVIGAVHISQHLAKIAASSGFNLEIIDPRTAFATPERFDGTTLHAEWPQTVLKDNPLDPYCALIAVTHDPKIDDWAIISALNARCFYIGALGSRKTHAKRCERLSGEGVTNEQLDKIHAPIGLNIAAANPAEIAVAILAQVIGAFRARGLA